MSTINRINRNAKHAYESEVPKDVRTKLANGEYKNKLPYIDIGEAKTALKNVGDLMESAFKLLPNSNETRESIMVSVPKLIADYESAKTQKALYYEEENRLYNQFIHDLEIENGMEKNPKKDLLWAKAWECGHSSGYEDVINIYEDLIELVK